MTSTVKVSDLQTEKRTSRAIVVINEQHTLMKEQRNLLDSKYESWTTCEVPASGWTLEEQKEKEIELQDHWRDIIFASPVPVLLMACADRCGKADASQYWGQHYPSTSNIYLFHNDKREKKELPGGKIINAVAQTGWQLVTTAGY